MGDAAGAGCRRGGDHRPGPRPPGRQLERGLTRIAAAPRRLISGATLLESSIVVESRRGEVAGRELDLFLHRAKVQTVAVDERQAEVARAAWRRYGKGRHSAGLNFGDLFAYALARASADTPLFKGDAFTKTDIPAA